MRGKGPIVAWAVLAVALILSMAAPALAQSGRATISGLVRDASGSVVPGVTVSAKNLGTNAVTTATTNADGLYSFRNLPLGTYAVSFTLQGFKPYTRDGIELHLGDVVTLDGGEALLSGQEFSAFTQLDRAAAKALMAATRPKKA